MGLSCHPLNARLGQGQDRRSSGASKEELEGERARGGGQREPAGFQPHLVSRALHRHLLARGRTSRCPENNVNAAEEQGQASSSPRRFDRPGFFQRPLGDEGDGAPKGAVLMDRASRARGRLAARQSRRLPASGPASSCKGRMALHSSAGSRQGLLVAPGGLRYRPSASLRMKPAGATPRPASRRLAKRPSTDEVVAS